MQLSFWTYEGPPHVGAMRVATGMRGLHYVLHAPQGTAHLHHVHLAAAVEMRQRF